MSVLTDVKERIIPPNSVRVFFNEDCMKYGVEVFDKGTSSGSLGWRQIDPHPHDKKRSAYTPYKKVAERWRENFLVWGERFL